MHQVHGRKLDLITNLFKQRSRGSSNPHDKVFALVGLSKDPGFSVDYNTAGGNMYSSLKNTIFALSGLPREVGFGINYDVNVVDLYRQFAISVVKFGALNVLERN